MADDEEDPSLVILNPFCWAKEAEEQQSARLTVRPQDPSSTSSNAAADDPWPAMIPSDDVEQQTTPGSGTGNRLASQGSSGSSYSRRPLVKQKNYCHSAEDLAINPPPPVTIHPPTVSESVSVPAAAARSSTDSHHHLKPAPFVAGGAGGGLRQQSSRQQSVESRVSGSSTARASAPVVVMAPSHHQAKQPASSSGGSGPIEDGAQLPAAFEPVPARLYGKPLQEIDPTVRDKVRRLVQLSLLCCPSLCWPATGVSAASSPPVHLTHTPFNQ